MFNCGDMVKADGSPPMRFIRWKDGVAECLLIDDDGVLRRRFLYSIHPMRLALQPRSLWPDTSQTDLVAIEREELHAAEVRRQRRRARRRSKRSKKIKRRAPVLA